MAAPFVGRRSRTGQREAAALISQNRRKNYILSIEIDLPSDGFFFSAAGQIVSYI